MYISASAPDAPRLSDTNIGCFIRPFFWIAACIMRAIWSEAPPAPAATTISTGLVGSHAKADAVLSARPASVLAKMPKYFLMSLLLWFAAVRLSGLTCGCFGAVRKILHRRADTFLLRWNAGEQEAHLDSGESAHQRQIVEVAEVSDAEHLAGKLAQAGAQRHVEGVENHFAHAVGIVSGGRRHCGDRTRIFTRIQRQDLEAPSTHRPP